jgi:hypothetical protein
MAIQVSGSLKQLLDDLAIVPTAFRRSELAYERVLEALAELHEAIADDVDDLAEEGLPRNDCVRLRLAAIRAFSISGVA